MATKRTIIHPNEELLILGNLIIAGSVTQISNTSILTNLTSNVLVLNSDGNAVTTTLSMNSDGLYANIDYNYNAPDRMVFNRAVNANLFLDASHILSIASGATLSGNVLQGNVSGTASKATRLATGRNFSLTGDVTAPAISFNGTGPVALSTSLATSGVTGATYGSASVVPVFSVNTKGIITSASNATIDITASQISDFVSQVNSTVETYISGGTGINESGGVISTNDGQIVHDNLSGFVTNEHVDHSTVTLTAGAGLAASGTGDLTASRTFDVVGGFGLTVNANDVEISNTDIQTVITNSASQVRAHFSAGDGITLTSGAIAVDSTVLRTNIADQTITGNLNINGNVDIQGNLNTQNVTDLYIEDIKITLNANNSSTNESVQIIAQRPLNTDTELRWNETSDIWQFTNDGSTYYPMATSTSVLAEGTNLYWTVTRGNAAIDARIVGGTGLTYSSGLLNVVAGDGITANPNNVTVNSTVIRTTGDQSMAGTKTFTGVLVGPTGTPTTEGAIYRDGSEYYAYVGGIQRRLTGADVGVVEDVGTGQINVYAGTRIAANVTYHGIKSLSSGGSGISLSESANVISINGRSDANIRALVSVTDNGGDGSLSYASGTGIFTYTGPSASEVRAHLSGTGLISYVAGTGVISTTADNYSSWKFTTDTAGNVNISSGGLLTFTAGTGIDVTHSGSTITIAVDGDADISSVTAGAGLTGGGISGAVTLDVGAGDGISVAADSVAVDSTVLRTNTEQVITAGDTRWNDGLAAHWGNSEDLSIYHDGSNSYIVDSGTGELRIMGSLIRLRNPANNETMIDATENGAVNLYYDNSSKLVTKSSGVGISGDIDISPASNVSNTYMYMSGYSTNFAGTFTIQPGGGSTDYGPGIKFYGRDHATKPGVLELGRSSNIGSVRIGAGGTGLTSDYARFNSGNVEILQSTTIGSAAITPLGILQVNDSTTNDNNIIISNQSSGYAAGGKNMLAFTQGTGSSINGRIGYDFNTNSMQIISGSTLGLSIDSSGAAAFTSTVATPYDNSGSTTLTTSSTTQTALSTFAHASYGSGRFLIQATSGGERHISEILIVHNGTTASATEYGVIQTSGSLYTVDVDISGANARVLITSASATSTVYKTSFTLVEA